MSAVPPMKERQQFRHGRRVALGLCVVLPITLVFVACGKRPPVLTSRPAEKVELRVSRSTQYYSVHGDTSTAIIDSLQRNSPVDGKGHRAGGLTSGSHSLAFHGTDTPAGCSSYAITLTLDLVVTLPQHDQPNSLSEALTARWQRLVSRVAAHEQRHFDIFLDGARTMKARTEAIPSQPSCAELEKEINRIWIDQKAQTDKAQDQFHAEDAARVENDRKPLRDQITVNQARLATLASEIRGLDRTVDDLKQRLQATHTGIEARRVEMAKSGVSPSNCSPARLDNRARVLCQRHDSLVEAYNVLAVQHNGVVSRRTALAAEHNKLLAVTNDLVEAYNWTW